MYAATPPAAANDSANDSADDIGIGLEMLRLVQRGRLDACRRYVRRVEVSSLALAGACLVLALVAGIVAPTRAQPLRGFLAAGGILNVLAAMLILRRMARALQGAMAEARAARIALGETERAAADFAAGRREKP